MWSIFRSPEGHFQTSAKSEAQSFSHKLLSGNKVSATSTILHHLLVIGFPIPLAFKDAAFND